MSLGLLILLNVPQVYSCEQLGIRICGTFCIGEQTLYYIVLFNQAAFFKTLQIKHRNVNT
jgi:hypothetical protein